MRGIPTKDRVAHRVDMKVSVRSIGALRDPKRIECHQRSGRAAIVIAKGDIRTTGRIVVGIWTPLRQKKGVGLCGGRGQVVVEDRRGDGECADIGRWGDASVGQSENLAGLDLVGIGDAVGLLKRRNGSTEALGDSKQRITRTNGVRPSGWRRWSGRCRSDGRCSGGLLVRDDQSLADLDTVGVGDTVGLLKRSYGGSEALGDASESIALLDGISASLRRVGRSRRSRRSRGRSHVGEVVEIAVDLIDALLWESGVVSLDADALESRDDLFFGDLSWGGVSKLSQGFLEGRADIGGPVDVVIQDLSKPSSRRNIIADGVAIVGTDRLDLIEAIFGESPLGLLHRIGVSGVIEDALHLVDFLLAAKQDLSDIFGIHDLPVVAQHVSVGATLHVETIFSEILLELIRIDLFHFSEKVLHLIARRPLKHPIRNRARVICIDGIHTPLVVGRSESGVHLLFGHAKRRPKAFEGHSWVHRSAIIGAVDAESVVVKGSTGRTGKIKRIVGSLDAAR